MGISPAFKPYQNNTYLTVWSDSDIKSVAKSTPVGANEVRGFSPWGCTDLVKYSLISNVFVSTTPFRDVQVVFDKPSFSTLPASISNQVVQVSEGRQGYSSLFSKVWMKDVSVIGKNVAEGSITGNILFRAVGKKFGISW